MNGVYTELAERQQKTSSALQSELERLDHVRSEFDSARLAFEQEVLFSCWLFILSFGSARQVWSRGKAASDGTQGNHWKGVKRATRGSKNDRSWNQGQAASISRYKFAITVDIRSIQMRLRSNAPWWRLKWSALGKNSILQNRTYLSKYTTITLFVWVHSCCFNLDCKASARCFVENSRGSVTGASAFAGWFRRKNTSSGACCSGWSVFICLNIC